MALCPYGFWALKLPPSPHARVEEAVLARVVPGWQAGGHWLIFTVLSSFRKLQQKEVPVPAEQRKWPPPFTSEPPTGCRQGTPSPGPSSRQLVPSRQPGSWPGPAYDLATLIALNILLPRLPLSYQPPPLPWSFVCTWFSPRCVPPRGACRSPAWPPLTTRSADVPLRSS